MGVSVGVYSGCVQGCVSRCPVRMSVVCTQACCEHLCINPKVKLVRLYIYPFSHVIVMRQSCDILV